MTVQDGEAVHKLDFEYNTPLRENGDIRIFLLDVGHPTDADIRRGILEKLKEKYENYQGKDYVIEFKSGLQIRRDEIFVTARTGR